MSLGNIFLFLALLGLMGIYQGTSTPTDRESNIANLFDIQDKQLLIRGQKNLFYEWLKYTTRQVSPDTCIVCHNANRTPRVLPLPYEPDSCTTDYITGVAGCSIQCVLEYMGNPLSKPDFATRCVGFDMLTLAANSFFPPVVVVPEGIVFPLCIIRMEFEPARRLQCSHHSRAMRFNCSHSALPMKCKEAFPVGAYVPSVYAENGAQLRYSFRIPKELVNGTRSVADIFWYCGDEMQIRDVLEPGWTGVCTPVMLSGTLSIMPLQPHQVFGRVERDVSGIFYEHDENVVVSYNGPAGIPYRYLAMSEEFLAYNPVFFPERNGRWINYLWYNQQRFINFTVKGLELVREQLHATSTMALQNRFVLDSLLAEDQGVCVRIGPDCCTVIPMHTGPGGNLTKVIKQLKDLRDEHVTNTAGGNAPWFDWLSSAAWKALLVRVGLILVLVLGLFMLLSCCVIPLLRSMVQKMVGSLAGQLIVLSPRAFSDMEEAKRELLCSKGDDSEDDLYFACD